MSDEIKVWVYDLACDEMLSPECKHEGDEIFLVEKRFYDKLEAGLEIAKVALEEIQEDICDMFAPYDKQSRQIFHKCKDALEKINNKGE